MPLLGVLRRNNRVGSECTMAPVKTLSRFNNGLHAVAPEVEVRPLEGTHPKYPFENIVFQGGGAKGVIYAGACLGLEELGITPYLKRFAAASAGCAPALFLALGLNGDQIKKETDAIKLYEFFDGGMRNIPVGKQIALGSNLLNNMGMHPAKKAMQHFGDVLERYTGNPDFTFLDLYKMNGKELCFSVSNISRKQTEYCHVNTTPDMPIRRAMRATMSLPFIWEPMELTEGEKYQDGAVFNNFPLKAFDGWYLSTAKEDSLFAIVGKENPKVFDPDTPQHEVVRAFKNGLASSFVKPNEKTLGFLLSEEESPDEAAYATFLQDLEEKAERSARNEVVEKAPQLEEIPFPDTKYARAYLAKKEKDLKVFEDSFLFERAFISMCTWFITNSDALTTESASGHPHAFDTDVVIKLLKKTPPKDFVTPDIFGQSSWDDVMHVMDSGDKGYITRVDQGKFWEKFGIRNAYLKNRKPKNITSVTDLAIELLSSVALVTNTESLLRDPNNAKRICSLNTKYIGLLSLKMEIADKQYLYELGKRDTIAWVKDRYT